MKITRCAWGESKNSLMQKYHDQIWGKMTTNDQELFEYLTLEIFQAGLSWETIINKQANFQVAFANFDIDKVANFTDQDIQTLLQNPGIIRNKLKINATINNAKIFQKIINEYGSFNNFFNQLWPEIIDNQFEFDHQIPATTPAANEFAKQLKKAGLKFVGPTIVYSFLQATGRVNDHIVSCSFKY